VSCPDGLFPKPLISAHQPAYFPWLGLLHKISLADVFVIFDCVAFEKGSFINRNRFRNPSGGWSWLTLPIDRASGAPSGNVTPLIRDLRLLKAPDWRRKHLEHLRHSYSRAPFFQRYFPGVSECLMDSGDDLTGLCVETTLLLTRAFGIRTPFLRSSEMDLRGRKDARVLDMTLKAGGKSFLFGALGSEYADRNLFSSAGVVPLIQEFPAQAAFSGFPPLSALDFLFLHGPDCEKAFSGGAIRLL